MNIERVEIYDVDKNVIIGDNSLNLIFSSKYDDIEHRGIYVSMNNIENIQSNNVLVNTFMMFAFSLNFLLDKRYPSSSQFILYL